MKIRDNRPICKRKSVDSFDVGECFVDDGTPYLVVRNALRGHKTYVNLLTGAIVDFHPDTYVEAVEAEVVIDHIPMF